MNEIDVDTWDGFLNKIALLYASHQPQLQDSEHRSKILFRGQPCHTMRLETTLQRWSGLDDYNLLQYHQEVVDIQNEIESLTDQNWNVPSMAEYDELMQQDLPLILHPPALNEYLVYLRHHGFPSPLLDWTTSPYIAAYFAFRGETKSSVAIFAYQEFAESSKGGLTSRPRIEELPPNVPAHRRHYLQMSKYTVAYKGTERERIYCLHEKAFEASEGKNQDLLWKITIPANLKNEALSYLQRYKIDAYSLFDSDEALMESLAVRRFVLNE